MATLPVLYRLNDDGEAEDVIWLCSVECRNQYRTKNSTEEPLGEGDNPDAIEGTVCEECGKQVA